MAKPIAFLLIAFFFSGCRQNGQSGHIAGKNSADTNTIAQHINRQVSYQLFIENSPSMDGYVEGNNTGFKNTLSKLASDISSKLNSDPHVLFIGDEIYPQPLGNTTAPDFIMSMKADKLRGRGRNPDTRIDEIINHCMDGLDSSINILTSDYIFSKKDVPPSKAEYDVKIFIAKKLQSENVTTIVLKYNSDYSGSYYSESNRAKVPLNRTINRPFYILLFGKEGNLLPLLSKIDFHQYPGFEASYCFVPKQTAAAVKTAVSLQNRRGSTFSFQKPASSMVIFDAAPDGNGVFHFSINANLRNLPADKDFLLDKANYSIDGNFKIDSIDPYTGSDSEYTHVFTLVTDDLQQNQNVKLGIKYTLPPWVKNTGTLADNNPYDTTQQKQTYGFTNLMEGISQGYIAKNDGDWQFAINTKISKGKTGAATGSAGFPWWVLIAVALVTGLIILIKIKR